MKIIFSKGNAEDAMISLNMSLVFEEDKARARYIDEHTVELTQQPAIDIQPIITKHNGAYA